jgi:hypothetical protein
MDEVTSMDNEEIAGDGNREPDQIEQIAGLLTELLAETRRRNRRGNLDFGNLDVRWFNVNTAAGYCGNYSPDRFRKIAAEYEIPRHGPHRNIYDRYELDEWILNPQCFRNRSAGHRGGRRAGSMDKIAHLVFSAPRLPEPVEESLAAAQNVEMELRQISIMAPENWTQK